MRRFPLDDQTADRILAGAVAPEDAPPGYARVAAALRTAAGVAGGLDARRQSATVASMEEALHAQPAPTTPRRMQMSRFATPKKAITAVAAALSLTGAAAAAGALPAPAQDVLGRATSHLGIDLPGGSTSHDAATTSVSNDETSPPASVPDGPHPPNHGGCVSLVAHGSPAGFATGEGSDERHGETVSAAARSDCGKEAKGGATTSTTAGTTTTTEADHERGAGSEDHPSPASAPSAGKGKSDVQHGQSDVQHGQSDVQHGQSDASHGNAGPGRGRD